MEQGVDFAVVGGEGGWFVVILDYLVGEGKMASGLAPCLFFTEIGRIAGNMENHFAGMIVICGIGVGRQMI